MDENTVDFRDKNLLLKSILYSGLTGLIVGIFIFLYRLVAYQIMEISSHLYKFVVSSLNYGTIALFFLFLIFLSILMYFLVNNIEGISGGGIAQSEGVVRGQLSFEPVKTTLGVSFASLISFLGGLSLGPEGPSVYIGTLIGSVVNKLHKIKNSFLIRDIHTAGNSAGFVGIMGTPISGMIFSIEGTNEVYDKHLILAAVVGGLVASLIAYFISLILAVDFRFINFSTISIFKLEYFYVPILIGIFCGVGAKLFNLSLTKTITLFNSLKKKKYLNIILIVIAFVITGVFGLMYNGFVGNGHDLIFLVINQRYLWYL
ncbi:MAG: chloride channel protein [Methanobrevibacter sp.]|jgi:H+/Cl- antiporter ClcA|nr:chloride channel protein [Methanobrevibacter sp.]